MLYFYLNEYLRTHEFLTRSSRSPTSALMLCLNQINHVFYQNFFDVTAVNSEYQNAESTKCVTVTGSYQILYHFNLRFTGCDM